ncbi:hypothetical protein GOP47_0007145 [Adiantum capillus-veneris]|uniref:Histone-lysine N-methyltransferase n=1 Tax=Adiantum capillus-veneris TaxID=13818 RepID=A0A9D4ZL87_ADICA|nr:hypothetical protein GOP47_0007145 [Adiantum capillus-veneris]
MPWRPMLLNIAYLWQGFHLSCLNLDRMPIDAHWLCSNCKDNKVQCFECKGVGNLKDDTMLKCLHKTCKKFYHQQCTATWSIAPEFASKQLCPLHVCSECGSRRNSGQSKLFRCLECPVAFHAHCYPDGCRLLEDIPGYMTCSKHDKRNCPPQGAKKCRDPEELLKKLPVPQQFCEFEVPRAIHEFVKKLKNLPQRPQPFVHIRRNIYLVKKPKRRPENEFMQCTCARAGKSRESCERDCICSMLQYTCSDGCGCGPSCTNLPFQRRLGRKLDLVKTEKCGWGIVAAERIKAGDFLIEYVGEVIDDKTCEERLWGIKERGESNFYMCEINREMVIDATFKGNISRFVNHSCCPNTQLQKWQIDEEIRIGVFAISDIPVGEAITYDYQFIPFGQDQTCFCGASACRGKLGRKPSKQKISASVALQIVRKEVFESRPIKRSRLCGLQVGNGYKSIDQIFRQRKLKFGAVNQCGALVPFISHGRPPATACLGLRVRIWWPLDERFYSGKIIDFDSKEGTHKIEYDDGDCEVLHMDKERWELEKPSLPLQKRRLGASTDAYTSEESYSPASSVDFVSKHYQLMDGGLGKI